MNPPITVAWCVISGIFHNARWSVRSTQRGFALQALVFFLGPDKRATSSIHTEIAMNFDERASLRVLYVDV